MVKPLVRGWEDLRRDLFVAMKEQLAQGIRKGIFLSWTHLINRWGIVEVRTSRTRSPVKAPGLKRIFLSCVDASGASFPQLVFTEMQ